jgi:muconate/chloromuconate cycloisomerase
MKGEFCMRIVRIEASAVQVELIKPYVTADSRKQGMTEKHSVVLRMFTDDGLCGIGESDPSPTFSPESPESVMQVIRHHTGPAVLGMAPDNLVALHVKMDSAVVDCPFAKAAIDVAAHDLLGQALGVPVYQLLGGRVRDQVPMIWPIGSGTPEDNACEAVTKVEEGYGSLHIKLGALGPEEDIARVKAIREAVGKDIALMVDVNQGWDLSTAIRAVHRLEEFDLSMVEQPVPAWDLESMAKIQASVDLPISADESLYSPHRAMELVHRDAARVFSLKTGKCGGLFRTRQIAAIAEAAGLPCFVNSMIEMGISVAASLHLAASIPNLVEHGHALMSNLRIKDDILLPDSFRYEGRNILIPEKCKGLGIRLDEEKLERRTLNRFVLEI